MRLPADYHMHTPLCHHAKGEPWELAEQALAKGLSEIGFSEHNPMMRDDWDDWHMQHEDLDLYFEKVRKAQNDFPSLQIKLALEVDYIPGHEDWVRELASKENFDYFIGSVHYISDEFDIDNPNKKDRWETRPVDDIWETYFDRLTLAASSGLYDIIGHADLCKKFNHRPEKDPSPWYRQFLTAARDHDVAIEINTAGLRKDCQEMYPCPELLQMAQQMGVALTFGSDAHAPGEVGSDFPTALALAKGAGYTHWRQFSGRQHQAVRL
jgi:histidinol-phosphatase (PHP family)